MDEWIKHNWFFAGSTILCGIGLAFALGARAEPKLMGAKNWWITLWTGLFGYYLFSVVLPGLRIGNILVLGIPVIFNSVATVAIAALWLTFRNQRTHSIRNIAIVSGIAAVGSVSLALAIHENNPTFGVVMEVISWVFFVLLAWEFRNKQVATAILLLVYANLQLPSGLFGKQGWGVDPLALLANKMSLIVAMYKTLGIRDA